MASKYSYLGGFDYTSNLMAASRYGIPILSTMSHAFVSSFTSIDEISNFIMREIDIKERALKYLNQMGVENSR